MKTEQTGIRVHIDTKGVMEYPKTSHLRGKRKSRAIRIIDRETEAVAVTVDYYESMRNDTVVCYVILRSEPGEIVGSHYGQFSDAGNTEEFALGVALENLGVTLYGNIYPVKDRDLDSINMDARAYVGGTGCTKRVLLAIAHELGCHDGIFIVT